MHRVYVHLENRVSVCMQRMQSAFIYMKMSAFISICLLKYNKYIINILY